MNEANIEWETDGSAMVSNGYGETRHYKIDVALKNDIISIADYYISRHMYDLLLDKKIGMFFSGIACVRTAIPKIHNYFGVIKFINEKVIKILKQYAITITNLDKNSDFLIHISQKRKYNDYCCICLEENFMGTKCNCGHTEVVMFRPCGHSICNTPCFRKLMLNKNIQTQPEIFSTNTGLNFIIDGGIDISNIKNFECPMCRTNVEAIFKVEKVSIYDNENLKKILIDEIYPKVIRFCY